MQPHVADDRRVIVGEHIVITVGIGDRTRRNSGFYRVGDCLPLFRPTS